MLIDKLPIVLCWKGLRKKRETKYLIWLKSNYSNDTEKILLSERYYDALCVSPSVRQASYLLSTK
mgnify:CR=1 FL=1